MKLTKKLDVPKWAVAVILIVTVIGALIATIAVGYMGIGPFAFLGKKETGGTGPTTPTVYKYTRPMKFTIKDIWAGGGVAASCVLYDLNLEQVDSGTADSDGIWTTSVALTSGEQYYLYVSYGNAKIYYKITVPTYSTPNTESYHYYKVDFYTLMSVTISMDDPTGTAISDGGTYNVTQAGNLYPTFTVMLRNTASSDSGYMEYYDPVKDVNRELVFYFVISGNQYENVIVKNVPLIKQLSTSRIYGFKVDPWKLVLDKKPDGTYNTHNGEDLDGIWTFTVQFDCSGMTTGSDGPEIAFYIYAFDNLNNLQTYGTDLSDALELQSTDFDFEIDA